VVSGQIYVRKRGVPSRVVGAPLRRHGVLIEVEKTIWIFEVSKLTI